ncbi:efflux RND transporter periplasmic adaptor subunit [Halocella sp. SP3-1]|uniref:efflux RND transporter periplasmic adaptor subunit n=1 Tax=Halocella sp. SP3-1 TaxID=2382161 RepID=UPI000F75B745|nr:efflux RND transporter periplasmic adaptor subunit [Halocella sp. SP3-1]AZO95873.1 efflux RND transporter periplasmic adaptor subunit [Halocella sp. SP3-1]
MFKKHGKMFTLLIIVLTIVGFFINKYIKVDPSHLTHRDINLASLYEVSRGNLEENISVNGYINPVNEREVSFRSRNSETRDTVDSIIIKEGDVVKRGDLLIVLDKTKERLEYLQAENEYTRAMINGSKNEIKEAEINLKMAEEDLEATELKSPITGLVTNIQVEEGDNVSGGTAAVNIIDNSRYEVEVDIPESDISKIKVGLKAKVSLDALPGQQLFGEVIYIEQEAEEDSGVVTVPVTVLLEEGDFDLKPGYSADVEIIIQSVNDKFIIPITAIYNKEGQAYVMKYEDSKLEEIPVKTGISNGLKIAVESGIEVGDKIMLNTFQFAQSPDIESSNQRPVILQ